MSDFRNRDQQRSLKLKLIYSNSFMPILVEREGIIHNASWLQYFSQEVTLCFREAPADMEQHRPVLFLDLNCKSHLGIAVQN